MLRSRSSREAFTGASRTIVDAPNEPISALDVLNSSDVRLALSDGRNHMFEGVTVGSGGTVIPLGNIRRVFSIARALSTAFRSRHTREFYFPDHMFYRINVAHMIIVPHVPTGAAGSVEVSLVETWRPTVAIEGSARAMPIGGTEGLYTVAPSFDIPLRSYVEARDAEDRGTGRNLMRMFGLRVRVLGCDYPDPVSVFPFWECDFPATARRLPFSRASMVPLEVHGSNELIDRATLEASFVRFSEPVRRRNLVPFSSGRLSLDSRAERGLDTAQGFDLPTESEIPVEQVPEAGVQASVPSQEGLSRTIFSGAAVQPRNF